MVIIDFPAFQSVNGKVREGLTEMVKFEQTWGRWENKSPRMDLAEGRTRVEGWGESPSGGCKEKPVGHVAGQFWATAQRAQLWWGWRVGVYVSLIVVVSIWRLLWVNGKPLEGSEWANQMTRLIFSQDSCSSCVCNGRRRVWKQRQQSGGHARIQVGDDKVWTRAQGMEVVRRCCFFILL